MFGRDFTGEDAHERGFARAIAAEQTDPLPRLDLARHAVKQRRAAKADADLVELNNRRHGDKRCELKAGLTEASYSFSMG
jgi:hypothetical protein